MKTDILNKYIKKRLNSVERLLKVYDVNNNSEHLHQIRVNIKKIKAVLLFAGYALDKKYKIDKIKNLFRNAGAIRELQLTIKLLKGLQNPPDKIILKLQIEEKCLKELFTFNISNFLKIVKKISSEISLPSMPVKNKSIEKYIKKEIKKANNEITGNERTNMHQLRKRLKKIMYIYKALSEKVNKKFILDSEYINKLQEKAGEWHDTYSALQFLTDQSKSTELLVSISELKFKENELFESLIENINFEKIYK